MSIKEWERQGDYDHTISHWTEMSSMHESFQSRQVLSAYTYTHARAYVQGRWWVSEMAVLGIVSIMGAQVLPQLPGSSV